VILNPSLQKGSAVMRFSNPATRSENGREEEARA
jgi:hypothetical protein